MSHLPFNNSRAFSTAALLVFFPLSIWARAFTRSLASKGRMLVVTCSASATFRETNTFDQRARSQFLDGTGQSSMTRREALRNSGYARVRSPKDPGSNPKLNVFEFFTECLGWLQIAASPFLLGLISGVIVYFSSPNPITLVAGVGLTFLGLLIGIIWATRVWKRRGTIWFMSRLTATPELDAPEKTERNRPEI